MGKHFYCELENVTALNFTVDTANNRMSNLQKAQGNF